jgi:putative transposase
MKLVVQVQLLPDVEQARGLRSTIERTNEAANWIAGVAFEHRESNVFDLRKLCYHEVRERFGLSSQQAQLAIKAVSDAYKQDRSIRPKFRKLAAIAFDQRTMSFKGIDRVSLLTLAGRVIVPMIVGAYQRERMALKKGQSDLVLRKDGKWFLIVTVDVPEGTPVPTTDFLGVDLGVTNLATDSDGYTSSGAGVEIGSPDGRSRSCSPSYPTRPGWRESPWSRWTRGIPAGPVAAAVIASGPTARARPNFRVVRAG